MDAAKGTVVRAATASRLARRFCGLTLAAAIAIGATAHAQIVQQGGFMIFPADGTRVPVVSGSRCAVYSVSIFKDDWQTGRGVIPGRQDTRAQAQRDEETVSDAVAHLLKNSPDMQTKTQGACDRLRTTRIVIYVVRGDRGAKGPAVYLGESNVIVVDMALVERTIAKVQTIGVQPADFNARALLVSIMLWTMIAHEMHHMFTGDTDTNTPNTPTDAVEDENQVMRELGYTTYARTAYFGTDPDGRPFTPYTVGNTELRVPVSSKVFKPAAPGRERRYCCAWDDDDARHADEIPEIDGGASHEHPTDEIWKPVFLAGEGPSGDSSARRGRTEIFVDAGAGHPSNPSRGDVNRLVDPTPVTTIGIGTLELPSHALHPELIDRLEGGPIPRLVAAAYGNNSARSIRVVSRLGMTRCPSSGSMRTPWRGVRLCVSAHAAVVKQTLRINREAAEAIEQTRSALVSKFNAILAGGVDRTVSAAVTTSNGGGLSVAFGGGAELQFGVDDGARLRPFVRAGVAFLPASDRPASATLELDYRFLTPGGAPFHETDKVIIRTRSGNAIGLQLGGGLRKALTDVLDLVLNVQADIYPNKVSVTVEANPARELGSPAGTVAFSAPAGQPRLVMSNVQAFNSSLNGRLPETTTFKGTGVMVMPAFSVGIARRF